MKFPWCWEHFFLTNPKLKKSKKKTNKKSLSHHKVYININSRILK